MLQQVQNYIAILIIFLSRQNLATAKILAGTRYSVNYLIIYGMHMRFLEPFDKLRTFGIYFSKYDHWQPVIKELQTFPQSLTAKLIKKAASSGLFDTQ